MSNLWKAIAITAMWILASIVTCIIKIPDIMAAPVFRTFIIMIFGE